VTQGLRKKLPDDNMSPPAVEHSRQHQEHTAARFRLGWQCGSHPVPPCLLVFSPGRFDRQSLPPDRMGPRLELAQLRPLRLESAGVITKKRHTSGSCEESQMGWLAVPVSGLASCNKNLAETPVLQRRTKALWTPSCWGPRPRAEGW
ncbi:hypothetical protein EWB00_001169, partial [Schistosoma japonicum]